MKRSPHRVCRGGRHGRAACKAVHGLAALSCCVLLGACAPRSGYLNHVQPDLAPEPRQAGKDSRSMYLDLIRQMQQQGAYYASLANIEAYVQRYGNPPELRRLQADALRETGQTQAAAVVYGKLLNTDQAGPAWHGLGLITAAGHQDDKAEQALSEAVRIDPVNPSYLGDLGYQRLRAGQVSAAHEPLAKAAELAPGSVKAVSNLVLWMLLSGDAAHADATMQQADLPQPAREEIRRLAVELRLAQPGVSSGPMAAAMPGHDGSRQVPVPQAQGSRHSGELPATRIVGVPDSMLERFGSSSTSSEVNP
ncbi:MAG: Flp pilus assembly protein TadD [Rhodanobacter sp.]